MAGTALTTLTRLTLSAAVKKTDTQIQLSALTNINVVNPSYSSTDKNAATLLWCDQELMRVLSIDDTTNMLVTVSRGVEGLIAEHGSGVAVFVGQPNQFRHGISSGYEYTTFDINPRINTALGRIFVNINGYWSSYISGDQPVLGGYGAPVNGTGGSGAGIVDPGTMYVDRTNAESYINVGTAASPLWLVLGNAT